MVGRLPPVSKASSAVSHMMQSRVTHRSLLRTRALIHGQWIPTGKQFSVLNPADGGQIAQVESCGALQAREAVLAAITAQPSWAGTPHKTRSDILIELYDLVCQHSEDLATIVAFESGKPMVEARAEIEYGARYIQWFAEEAKRINGSIIPAPTNSGQLLVKYEPVGVVAAITPWNFPFAMLARKVAPALAAGCSVVCKPSEETPLTALAFGQLCCETGLPDGAINIIMGDAQEIGLELTSNDQVRKLTFTGSTPVGCSLSAACMSNVKRVSLELGGNAPFIVFEHSDLDAAADGLIAAKLRNAGQTCISPNRIFVEKSINDPFIAKLRERLNKVRVGHCHDETANLGPLINTQAKRRIERLVADAIDEGAVMEFETPGRQDGLFLPPKIVRVYDDDARIFSEEIFGPVIAVSTFETEEEVIQRANASPYGLAAYAYTIDNGRSNRLVSDLQFGMIGINSVGLSNEMAPFGGIKQSGIGREGSVFGITEYLQQKYCRIE